MGQTLVISQTGTAAAGNPSVDLSAGHQKPGTTAEPARPAAKDAAPSQAAKVEDAAARTKLTGGGVTLGTGGPMAPGKGAFADRSYSLIVSNPSERPMSVNVVSARSGLGSTSSRLGCRSLDIGFGDVFEFQADRRAKGKSEDAKVTVLGDRFRIDPARDKEGGRCGWQLGGTYVQLHVGGEGVDQTLGIRISDGVSSRSSGVEAGTFHEVECRPTGSRVSTTNKRDVPPGAADLAETVRADGVVVYSYTAADGLWCSADGGKSLTNGGIELAAHKARGAEIRLNINLASTYKR